MPTTTTAVDEIRKLEEGLVQAALNPDPEFFRKYVDDDMVMVTGEKHC
ncbi:MAG: nuclear transport factor 2 family protein [Cyanobacteria bacterium]|nr:nuclear transport factor 2 family protein [Cyanobacteriota bacterium]